MRDIYSIVFGIMIGTGIVCVISFIKLYQMIKSPYDEPGFNVVYYILIISGIGFIVSAIIFGYMKEALLIQYLQGK